MSHPRVSKFLGAACSISSFCTIFYECLEFQNRRQGFTIKENPLFQGARDTNVYVVIRAGYEHWLALTPTDGVVQPDIIPIRIKQ